MANEKDTQIAKAEKLAKLLGVDFKAALVEVQQKTVEMAVEQIKPLLNQSTQPVIDLDVLAAKVAVLMGENQPVSVDTKAVADAVIAQIGPGLNSYIEKTVLAAKIDTGKNLAEGLEVLRNEIRTIKISGGQADESSIIVGVFEKMKPAMLEMAQKAAEAAMKANMAAELQRVIEERQKAAAAEQSPGDGQQAQVQQQQTAPQGGGFLGGGLGGILQMVFALADQYPEGAKLIMSFIKPQPSTALMADPRKKLQDAYELTKILNGLKVDGQAADKLIETLTTEQGKAPPA
ncbi:MAG: hypothetical protein WC454_10220 [Phycisphaerae bacterium]|jgi:hypothetical protein